MPEAKEQFFGEGEKYFKEVKKEKIPDKEPTLTDLPIFEDPSVEDERKVIEFSKSPFTVDFGTGSLRRAALNERSGKIRVSPTFPIGTASRRFLKIHPDFLISGVLEADATVTSVAGTAAETTLNSYTIPLNTISRNDTQTEKAGNVFRVWAAGRYTTDDATSTVAIALKVGGTTHHTITTTGATVTDVPWHINWVFIVSAIGSSGTAESQCEAKTNNVNKDSANTATITINTTIAQAITLTATWTGGSAGDNISIRQFIVELIN